jgi:hypothetical protein
MKKALALTFVFVLAIAVGLFAQGKPDFSGKWQLDAAKSDQMGGGGRGPGGGGPLTVKQTETELTTERTRGEQVMTTTYKLDGTETTTQGQMGASKASAKWDGTKIVTKTTRETPNGSMEFTETWSLSADGKELTILRSSARGESKQVYTKQ